MRDYLGKSRWDNLPIKNITQNIFTRFVRQPQAGLPDLLKDTRDKFEDFGKKALKTRLSEYLED